MNDSMQQFEAWVSGRTVVKKYGAKLTQRVDGSYADYRINDRWLAWQASRAALVVELPKIDDDFSHGYCIDEVQDALTAAGVSYQ